MNSSALWRAGAGFLFLAAMSALLAAPAADARQASPSIGIDTDPTGSTDTSLGSIEECAEIAEGETLEIGIFADNVEDLLAWTASLTYDKEVISIEEISVGFLLNTSEGSDVQDVSQPAPDSDGRIEAGAFDASDPPAPDSGSGLLATVVVRGAGPGVSAVELDVTDTNNDGEIDTGPLLQDQDVQPIGDSDGDTFFDGPIENARIAVDASCGDQPGTPTGGAGGGSDDDGGGDGTSTLLIIAVIAAVAAVGAVAVALGLRARRRS